VCPGRRAEAKEEKIPEKEAVRLEKYRFSLECPSLSYRYILPV
jgi:hypothetical protein